jgi:hypothetical protein
MRPLVGVAEKCLRGKVQYGSGKPAVVLALHHNLHLNISISNFEGNNRFPVLAVQAMQVLRVCPPPTCQFAKRPVRQSTSTKLIRYPYLQQVPSLLGHEDLSAVITVGGC